MPALLLFDLDGTLVQSNGAGTIAIDRAFAELFGLQEAAHIVDWRGKPDTRIFREILATSSIPPTAARLQAVQQRYLQYVKELAATYPGQLPPGIPGILAAAQRDPRFRLALGTGNLEAGCRAKLEVHHLNGYFPVGGFAEDGENRRELIQQAWRRAVQYYDPQGRLGFFDRVVVVGDTPLDIDAATANDFYSLAVATGSHTLPELQACSPTLAYPDLAAVDAILMAVAALPPHPWADPVRRLPSAVTSSPLPRHTHSQ